MGKSRTIGQRRRRQKRGKEGGDYDRERRCIRGKEGRVSEKDDFVLLKTMLDKVTRCCRGRGVFV